jgi:hypothetical protein
MDAQPVAPPATNYEAAPGHMPQMDRDRLTAALGTLTLLDARAAERYRGETEPVDPVAGHIPTALSAPLTDNLEPDQRFKSPELLAEQLAALGGGGDEVVVSYCGSGVTACHNILAMARWDRTPAVGQFGEPPRTSPGTCATRLTCARHRGADDADAPNNGFQPSPIGTRVPSVPTLCRIAPRYQSSQALATPFNAVSL